MQELTNPLGAMAGAFGIEVQAIVDRVIVQAATENSQEETPLPPKPPGGISTTLSLHNGTTFRN